MPSPSYRAPVGSGQPGRVSRGTALERACGCASWAGGGGGTSAQIGPARQPRQAQRTDGHWTAVQPLEGQRVRPTATPEHHAAALSLARSLNSRPREPGPDSISARRPAPRRRHPRPNVRPTRPPPGNALRNPKLLANHPRGFPGLSHRIQGLLAFTCRCRAHAWRPI